MYYLRICIDYKFKLTNFIYTNIIMIIIVFNNIVIIIITYFILNYFKSMLY